MKRLFPSFALLAVVALFVRVASADYEVLYFMISDPVSFSDGTTLSANDYNYVMVAPSDDGETTAGDYLFLTGDGDESPSPQGQVMLAGDELVYAFLDSRSPTESILFELWYESPEGSFERVAYHSASVSDLRSQLSLVSYDDISRATPYVVSSVVPEPTSGLLMVFGLAGLALRRKRV